MEANLLQKVKDQLIRHERLKLKPYRCPAGMLTIGVGRNLDDRGITQKEAFQKLYDSQTPCEKMENGKRRNSLRYHFARDEIDASLLEYDNRILIG